MKLAGNSVPDLSRVISVADAKVKQKRKAIDRASKILNAVFDPLQLHQYRRRCLIWAVQRNRIRKDDHQWPFDVKTVTGASLSTSKASR